MTGKNIIHIKDLIVRRGQVTVLDISDFKVARGRILALIGPNGAGKSTLLLTLAGLLRPTRGKLFFQDTQVDNMASLNMLRRNASVVFQEPLLLNDTVYKNVALGLKFRRLTGDETRKSVNEALNYFGIAHLAKRSAKTLSGGEAKRVSLARAFAIKPQLILLDETFNSLDPPSREIIISDLHNILEKTKITAVLALHDREETLRLAQDVAFMNGGKIIQVGTTANIFNHPADEFVADFVGTESILEGKVISEKSGLMEIAVNGKIIEAAGNFSVGQRVFCCLRPENIIVSQAMPGKMSARNIFEAKVQKIIRQAFFYKIFLDCGFPLTAYITVASREDLGLSESATVAVSFKATAVHVLRREK